MTAANWPDGKNTIRILDNSLFSFRIVMNPGAPFYKLIHLSSPRTWLAIAAVSMVLAAGSGMVLVSRLNLNADDALVPVYDWARRFTRDTIRLTFKTDEGPQETVFVAPRGILEQTTVFKAVENYEDFVPSVTTSEAKAQAPLRVLDADWTPAFSGKKEDTDS